MDSERPLFIMTMGERKAAEEMGQFDALARLMHYREVAATRYIWDLPESVPEKYPEYAIFDTGGIGRVDYAGSSVPMAGRTSLYGALGEPLKWTPVTAGIYHDPELLRERMVSEAPYMIVDRVPLSEAIEPLCRLQAQAWNCLDMSIEIMKQPIVIESPAGGELNAVKTADGLKSNYKYLKTLEKTALNAKVLDTGGHDYTQNLLTTAGAIDSEILSIMGIPALGTVKTSGVSEAEAGAMAIEMRMIINTGLTMRKKLCRMLSKDGLDMDVRINPDLIIEDASERDNTSNLTITEKRNARRAAKREAGA